MDILSQVAETIKSICESENLIFKLNYRGRNFGRILVKILSHVLWTVEDTAQLYLVQHLLL